MQREERKIVAEGMGNEFRSECLSGEKGGFVGRRDTSGKA